MTALTFGSSSAAFKSAVIEIPSSSPTSLAAAAFGSTARTSSISRDCLFIRAPILRPHQPSPTNATPTIPSSPILHNLLAALSRGRVRHDDQRRCEMVLMVDDLAHFVRRDCAGIHRIEDELDAVDIDPHTAHQADINFLAGRRIGARAAPGVEMRDSTPLVLGAI